MKNSNDFYFQERSIWKLGGGCHSGRLGGAGQGRLNKIYKIFYSYVRGPDATELGSIDQIDQSLLYKMWMGLFSLARLTQRSNRKHFPWVWFDNLWFPTSWGIFSFENWTGTVNIREYLGHSYMYVTWQGYKPINYKVYREIFWWPKDGDQLPVLYTCTCSSFPP